MRGNISCSGVLPATLEENFCSLLKASEAGWMLYCYGTIKNGEVFLRRGRTQRNNSHMGCGKPRDREYKRFRQSFCLWLLFLLSPLTWSKEIYWFLPVKLLKETLSPSFTQDINLFFPSLLSNLKLFIQFALLLLQGRALRPLFHSLGWELIFFSYYFVLWKY